MSTARAAIITGAGRRIGKALALRLFRDGYALLLHCCSSTEDVLRLAATMNAERPGAATCYTEDFTVGLRPCGGPLPRLDSTTSSPSLPLSERCDRMVGHCVAVFGRCDVLVNNASAYFASPLAVEEKFGSAAVDRDADEAAAALFGSNALAPFFLIRAFAAATTTTTGSEEGAGRCVINLADSMVHHPLVGYGLYTMAKHALEGLTKAAAVELAPQGIRVNAVAPGLSELPPDLSESQKSQLRQSVPLTQTETPAQEIADAAAYLLTAPHVTGTFLHVDGGWRLTRPHGPLHACV
eukprot:gene6513-4690_t